GGWEAVAGGGGCERGAAPGGRGERGPHAARGDDGGARATRGGRGEAAAPPVLARLETALERLTLLRLEALERREAAERAITRERGDDLPAVHGAKHPDGRLYFNRAARKPRVVRVFAQKSGDMRPEKAIFRALGPVFWWERRLPSAGLASHVFPGGGFHPGSEATNAIR